MPDEPRPKEKTLAEVGNGRTDAQREHMQQVNQTGICPFCVINPDINKVIKETVHWRIMFNAYPYHHHSHHLVLMPKRHVTDITDLTGGEWAEWGALNAWAIREFNLPGGGLVFRFGSFEKSAATMAHLHSHIQVPDGTGAAFAVFCKDGPFGEFLSELHKRALASKATKS